MSVVTPLLGIEVDANQLALGAQIKVFVGEHGRGPARIFQFGVLVLGDFLKFFGIGSNEAEETAFAKDNQLAVRQNG